MNPTLRYALDSDSRSARLRACCLSTSFFAALILVGCAEPQIKPSDTHLKQSARPSTPPPALVSTPSAPAPKKAPRVETYSVVVNNIPVRELLFALARDAKIDVDIASDVDGSVTMNAIDQTLPQLLERLSKQADMRWELDGKLLTVNRDTPFLRNYRVDYVNLKREATSTVNVASQIAGAGTSTGGSAGGTAGNSSTTAVVNTSVNSFWETLNKNIVDLLRETDKKLPPDCVEETSTISTRQTNIQGPQQAPTTTPSTTPRTAQIVHAGDNKTPPPLEQKTEATMKASSCNYIQTASVIANPETGVIAVRATARQHERIKDFLDRVLRNAHRQVLIEATIVEVSLNDASQSGIDWKRLAIGSGFTFRQNTAGTNLSPQGTLVTPNQSLIDLISNIQGNDNLSNLQRSSLVEQIARGMGTYPNIDPGTGAVALGDFGAKLPLTYDDSAFNGGKGMTIGYGNGLNFAAALKLLSTYGRVKVISSPKITALNNQTAILRVVDNLVYFTINAQTTNSQTISQTTYTSTPNTVAVGFVMSVVPQIDDNHLVTLNVRPTVSRLRGYVQDPNPSLRDIPNLVPVVQTRELESIMKVPSGNVAMMGGLMEDRESRDSEGLPGLGDLPGIGKLFSNRNSATSKTELVIFIRPVVITDPSIDGDYAFARDMLPGKKFFNQPVERPVPGFTTAPREDSE